jgi:hypothetical protein
MAVLTAFRTDSTKIKQGDWVSPGDEYDDLEILVRGYTDEYADERAKRFRKLASRYQGDIRNVPAARQRQTVIDLMIDFLVLDVRGLCHPNGEKIGIDEFKQLLRDPDYQELVNACQKAAASVGVITKSEDEDAVKN